MVWFTSRELSYSGNRGWGPERFDITIRMCRGDDGSYINATGHYVTSAVNSMSVTPTSATLQSPGGNYRCRSWRDYTQWVHAIENRVHIKCFRMPQRTIPSHYRNL